MQRDEYLPLKVIKERLLHQDEGGDDAARRPTARAPSAMTRRPDDEIAEAPTGLQMSLEEMSTATGVDRDRIKELEAFGIVCAHGPEGARYYDGDDFIILSIVKDFFRYGIEPRHLTMYKHFADREVLVLRPDRRADAPSEEPRRAPRRGADAANLSTTSRKFKQALLRTNLRDHLRSA